MFFLSAKIFFNCSDMRREHTVWADLEKKAPHVMSYFQSTPPFL